MIKVNKSINGEGPTKCPQCGKDTAYSWYKLDIDGKNPPTMKITCFDEKCGYFYEKGIPQKKS